MSDASSSLVILFKGRRLAIFRQKWSELEFHLMPSVFKWCIGLGQGVIE